MPSRCSARRSAGCAACVRRCSARVMRCPSFPWECPAIFRSRWKKAPPWSGWEPCCSENAHDDRRRVQAHLARRPRPGVSADAPGVQHEPGRRVQAAHGGGDRPPGAGAGTARRAGQGDERAAARLSRPRACHERCPGIGPAAPQRSPGPGRSRARNLASRGAGRRREAAAAGPHGGRAHAAARQNRGAASAPGQRDGAAAIHGLSRQLPADAGAPAPRSRGAERREHGRLGSCGRPGVSAAEMIASSRFPAWPEQGPDALERELLALWKTESLFARGQEARRSGTPFVFYEGPPTANGRPGIHHVFSRSIKDLFCRVRVMQGRSVTRIAGWDTHGLPVEIEGEQKLALSGKKDIEAFGVAEFNRLCRESVFTYLKDWEELSDRIGYWLDYENPYVTRSEERRVGKECR